MSLFTICKTTKIMENLFLMHVRSFSYCLIIFHLCIEKKKKWYKRRRKKNTKVELFAFLVYLYLFCECIKMNLTGSWLFFLLEFHFWILKFLVCTMNGWDEMLWKLNAENIRRNKRRKWNLHKNGRRIIFFFFMFVWHHKLAQIFVSKMQTMSYHQYNMHLL